MLKHEFNRIMDLTDMEEAICVKLRIETADPNLANDLIEQEEPICTQFNTLSFCRLPRAVQPWTEIVEPRRMNERTEREDPPWIVPSSTFRYEPSWPKDLTLSVECVARRPVSSFTAPLPTLKLPAMLTALPNLTAERRLNIDPK